jgi:hypothetical protein
MRASIRKMMGEAHWMMFLEYHNQYRQNRRDRTKIQLADSYIIVSLPPPFPTLSLKLDERVTSSIFSFSQWQGHVRGIQSFPIFSRRIGATPKECNYC